mgnify:CR=1 FL=1
MSNIVLKKTKKSIDFSKKYSYNLVNHNNILLKVEIL